MFVLNDRHVLAICDRTDRARLRPEYLGICAGGHGEVRTCSRICAARASAGSPWVSSPARYVRDGAGRRSKIIDIVDWCEIQAAGINVIGNFIFGLPDDDLKRCRRDAGSRASSSIANSPISIRRWLIRARRFPHGGAKKAGRCPTTGPAFAAQLRLSAIADGEGLRGRGAAVPRQCVSIAILAIQAVSRHGHAAVRLDARRHVERMTRHKLRRKILEPSNPMLQRKPPLVSALVAQKSFGTADSAGACIIAPGTAGTRNWNAVHRNEGRIGMIISRTPFRISLLAAEPIIRPGFANMAVPCLASRLTSTVTSRCVGCLLFSSIARGSSIPRSSS